MLNKNYSLKRMLFSTFMQVHTGPFFFITCVSIEQKTTLSLCLSAFVKNEFISDFIFFNLCFYWKAIY